MQPALGSSAVTQPAASVPKSKSARDLERIQARVRAMGCPKVRGLLRRHRRRRRRRRRCPGGESPLAPCARPQIRPGHKPGPLEQLAALYYVWAFGLGIYCCKSATLGRLRSEGAAMPSPPLNRLPHPTPPSASRDFLHLALHQAAAAVACAGSVSAAGQGTRAPQRHARWPCRCCR